MGAITPTHCDYMDSYNRCFAGAKLWLIALHHEVDMASLAWCTTCAKSNENPRDRFDVCHFMSLPSARMVIVNEDTMLFLPRQYVHLVYTFRPYVGAGLFHLSMNQVGSVFRDWLFHPPKHCRPNDTIFWHAMCKAVLFRCKQSSPLGRKWPPKFIRSSIG